MAEHVELTKPIYKVEQLFIGGFLEGLTYDYETTSPPPVGFVCYDPIGKSSPYKVVNVTKLQPKDQQQ